MGFIECFIECPLCGRKNESLFCAHCNEPGKRLILTKKEQSLVKASFANGAMIEDIADRFGCTVWTIGKILGFCHKVKGVFAHPLGISARTVAAIRRDRARGYSLVT